MSGNCVWLLGSDYTIIQLHQIYMFAFNWSHGGCFINSEYIGIDKVRYCFKINDVWKFEKRFLRVHCFVARKFLDCWFEWCVCKGSVSSILKWSKGNWLSEAKTFRKVHWIRKLAAVCRFVLPLTYLQINILLLIW